MPVTFLAAPIKIKKVSMEGPILTLGRRSAIPLFDAELVASLYSPPSGLGERQLRVAS